MIKFLKRFIIKLIKLNSSNINLDSQSKFIKDKDVKIINCSIILKNSTLEISDFVELKNLEINLNNAHMIVGSKSIIEGTNPNDRLCINIIDGKLLVGLCTRLRSSIIVRYGGFCKIDNYNAINEGSEIRCDEKVAIGSFNMISYNCQLFDTNTHNILPVKERRAQTIEEYPIIGREKTKPPTKPLIIGDDCWFGQGVTILKGVTIGDGVVIGTKSVVTKDVPPFHIAAGNPAKTIKQIAH
jgi:acetyltransferase-like isoleucine patch superfamily enzyme